MELKSITLKNIRSYESLNLDFKSGSSLLSGDIGSGKTTILLSIEFALFGLMKGMLTGNSLLRHGSKDGTVTLTFVVGQDKIIVNRALKRTSSGISQDSGYIQINGIKTDCTAVELKSKILNLLGYPDELLTKSKSLIFRYTVYTPQEEMKQIILDSEDDRVEKLTKIFSIDKYKRIKENAELYSKELRAETKILPVINKELDDIKEKGKKFEMELEDKSILLQKTQERIVLEDKNLKEIESKVKTIEESRKKFDSLNREQSIVLVEIKNLKRTFETTNLEITNLEQKKKTITVELKAEKIEEKIIDVTKINDEITNYKDKKEDMEKKIIESKSKLGTIKRIREEAEEIKLKIKSLDKCPTCQQNVGDSHKEHIVDVEDKKLKDLVEKEEKIKDNLKKAENNLIIIQKKLESLNINILEAKEQQQKNVYKKKQELYLKETEDKIVEKNKLLTQITLDIKLKEEKIVELKNKIEETLIDEKVVKEIELDQKNLKEVFMTLKVNEGKITQTITELNNNLERLEEEKEKKNKTLQMLNKKKNLEHWLSNHFINLVDVIEKNVMSSIRAEFKSYFEDWFSMLIEDESITATLDERFTPKITQNGYDTEIENLSGGEKTSVALAYRLALNKVINNIISTIKTKDLIILDEPTDGFSSHQLDKVRDVLEALNSKQTIIVSHESKMESFVDHIIKIRKHEHESEVM